MLFAAVPQAEKCLELATISLWTGTGCFLFLFFVFLLFGSVTEYSAQTKPIGYVDLFCLMQLWQVRQRRPLYQGTRVGPWEFQPYLGKV